MAKPLPAGFIVPAQPIRASKPPPGPDWVHEIKHDGYRLIVRRDGPTVRLYTRSAYDWTVRLPAIAAAAQRIKAKSFTIDGEAVVLGLTACHASTSCFDGRPHIARCFTPAI
jgi:ATP-dependent DNA ligase